MRIIDWSSGVCSSDLQPGAQAAVAQIAADRGRGAARAGAADHPRRLRLRFAGELADDRFGDVVVAAPVGGAIGQAELVEMAGAPRGMRSEEHTSELQSLKRKSYAAFRFKKKKTKQAKNIAKGDN